MYIYCIYIYIKSLTSKAVFLTHFTDFGIEHFTCTIYNRLQCTEDCTLRETPSSSQQLLSIYLHISIYKYIYIIY